MKTQQLRLYDILQIYVIFVLFPCTIICIFFAGALLAVGCWIVFHPELVKCSGLAGVVFVPPAAIVRQEELSFTVDCFRSMVNIMLVEKVNADEAARLDWVQDD